MPGNKQHATTARHSLPTHKPAEKRHATTKAKPETTAPISPTQQTAWLHNAIQPKVRQGHVPIRANPTTTHPGNQLACPHPETPPLSVITLKNVTLRRGVKVLLDSASVNLNPGEKVGLVGRNGAGKSSLFALLNGNLHEDASEFSIPTQ